MFRAAVGPQTIWYLIIRYSASATQLKNTFIKLLYLNSISPQMRSLPLKALTIPRKSQEAFHFKVSHIKKLGDEFFFFPSISPLNFKLLVFLSQQLSHFQSRGRCPVKYQAA